MRGGCFARCAGLWQTQVLDCDGLIAAQQQAVVDDVFQFADVAWPRVVLKGVFRAPAEGGWAMG